MKKKANFNLIHNNKGFTLIELLAAMTIMALLGTALLSLINTGSNSFLRIKDNYLAENEARVAMSYINVKIKQNDVEGKISVVDYTPSQKGLKIVNPSDSNKYYEIYLENGMVMEKYTIVGTSTTTAQIAGNSEANLTPGFIGNINGLVFGKPTNPDDADFNNITVTITYPGGTLKETITLRTG